MADIHRMLIRFREHIDIVTRSFTDQSLQLQQEIYKGLISWRVWYKYKAAVAIQKKNPQHF